MPEPPKKRLCLRCNDNKEYKEEDAMCANDHDISLENYLFRREEEHATKAKADADAKRPKSMLGNLAKAVKK
jgi:hypothetical protein